MALNAGSSSIKFAVAAGMPDGSFRRTITGRIEGFDTAPHLIAYDAAGASLCNQRLTPQDSGEYEAVLSTLLTWIESHLGTETLVGVGHRIVHGGRDFTAPVRLDAEILRTLDRLISLAPLHQPHSLAPACALMTTRPDLPQVACFDTAFHQTLPGRAWRFALPRHYEMEGVRRYGFHGLSYEYIAIRLREIAPALAAGRIVVAHLGSGASLCAMRNGQSIDTTMGFTALDGLVMGTRCGAIDPGVLLFMLQQKHMTPDEVEHVLYHESGLLGVSGGISSDMRELLASQDPRAAQAVELFVTRIARETAALATSLDGLDGLVFTAGIGEHAAEIRAAVCKRLRWLGLVPDSAANDAHSELISAPESHIVVRVLPTDEEAIILRDTQRVLGS